MTKPSGAPREPVRPPEYFEHYGAATRRQMELTLESGNPAMFLIAADYCRYIARATYSSGASIESCQGRLSECASYLRRYFAEGVNGRLSDLHEFKDYLDGFSAAALVGQAQPVIDAFEAVRPAQAYPWDRALLGGIEAVLLGRPLPDDPEGYAAASRQKEYAGLPELFDAIVRRDQSAFATTLDAYLSKTWGPAAERAAKASLARPYPAHPGKWSLFAAAACSVVGQVPPLSKKALQYVPVELIVLPA